MPDPVTLSVLGGWAAAEGIKFIYGQAAELLKTWREQRKKVASGEPAPAHFSASIVDNQVLDGRPGLDVVDGTVVDRESKSLVQLMGALSPYAQGQAEIDLADTELAEQAGRLRALLEAAYGQRLTFRGEQRDPTGTRVTVKQVLGDVEGVIIGADADVGPGGDLAVDQNVKNVKSDGSVTGFKGRIGGFEGVEKPATRRGHDEHEQR